MIHGVQRQPKGGYNPAYLGAEPADSCNETVPDVTTMESFNGSSERLVLQSSEVFTQTISSEEAADIASESAHQQAISDAIDSVLLTISSFIIGMDFSTIKKGLNVIDGLIQGHALLSSNSNSNIHVDSGTYYTTVAIYANDTGEKFVLTKNFSLHSASYLHIGWGWSGYDPSKTMEDYSKLTAYHKDF